MSDDDIQEFKKMRRMLLEGGCGMAWLAEVHRPQTLGTRNVIHAVEELLKAVDAWQAELAAESSRGRP